MHHSSHHVEVLSKLSENGTLSFAVDSKGTREVNLQFMKIQLPDSGTHSTTQITPTPFKQIRDGAWTNIACLGPGRFK